MAVSVQYKDDAFAGLGADGVALVAAEAIKKQATYFDGPKGEEQAQYSQSYFKGSVDRTTLYTHVDRVLKETFQMRVELSEAIAKQYREEAAKRGAGSEDIFIDVDKLREMDIQRQDPEILRMRGYEQANQMPQPMNNW